MALFGKKEGQADSPIPVSREDIYGLLIGAGKYKGMGFDRRRDIWNRWRKMLKREKIDLRGYDLSAQNLIDFDLTYINFKKANLRKANIQGANLYKAFVSMVDVRGANLRKANIQESKPTGRLVGLT